MKMFEKSFLEHTTQFFLKNQPLENTYLSAMYLFWNSEYDASISKVSDFLMENELTENHLCFYRLWIENLVEKSDEKGLENLKDHLLVTARSSPELKNEIFALVGFVFNELHDSDAVQVFSLALQKNYGSAYVNEFMSKTSGSPRNIVARMLAGQPVLQDYFHFAVLAFHGEASFSGAVLKSLKKLYPGSPLENIFEYHKSVTIKNYAAARIHAQALTRTYALNKDYLFYECFALSQMKKHEEVISTIVSAENSLAIDLSGDADFHHLLASAYENLNDSSSQSIEKALVHRQFATALLKANAQPTFLAKKKLQDHFDMFVESQSFVDHAITDEYVQNLNAIRHWMIQVNQSDFLQLMTSPLEKIREIEKPMGKEMKKGELCFVMARSSIAKDLENREVWTLGAIYESVTQPAWDPMYGHVSTLRLVERIEDRILLDIHMADKQLEKDSVSSHDVRGPSWKVFEMDDSALARLTESIKRHNDGIDHSSERRFKSLSQKKPM